MDVLTLDSPAKINLLLSIHGRRADGFHDLTSLVVTLDFGDKLKVSKHDWSVDRLRCSDTDVPTDRENLVLRAAHLFRRESACEVYFDFYLEKHIPIGSGLGGGSSNAVLALKAMNQLTDEPLSRNTLLNLSAELGSDCPFFVNSVPTFVSGRGEQLKALDPSLAERIRGQKVILFRPDFQISTAWAYRQLAESKHALYTSKESTQASLRAFEKGGPLRGLLGNTFESCIARKYLPIACLLQELRSRGYDCLMSGSGSCCFALVAAEDQAESIRRICRDAWGPHIFFIETFIN